MIYKDLPDLISCIRHDSAWTPDVGALTKKWVFIPVFIYGTHMQTFSDSDTLKGCPRLGVGYTCKSEYVMYKTADQEPVVFRQEEPFNPDTGLLSGRIRGEVYQVPVPTLCKLDAELCNGDHFVREETVIKWWAADDRRTEDTRQDYLSRAWMYIGRREGLMKLQGSLTLRPQPRFNFSPSEGGVFLFRAMDELKRRGKKKTEALSHTHEV